MRTLLLLAVLLVAACGDDSTLPADGGSDDAADAPFDSSADSSADATASDAGSDAFVSSDAGDDAGPADPCPRVRVVVAAGASLNVRAEPRAGSAMVGSLPRGAIVTVLERVTGELVLGNPEWFRIGDGGVMGFVAGAFAECTTEPAPTLMPPAAYYLPLVCGTSSRISQGNNGSTSHMGRSRYAFDFAIPVNTPMVAMADGIVDEVFDETGPGDDCYNGGGPGCFRFANYVALRHGDGTGSIYKHLNRVDVSAGQFVPAGITLGLSGSTGYSTGPHAHVMRQEVCGEPLRCDSVPLSFADVPGGVPSAGDTVRSGNCP